MADEKKVYIAQEPTQTSKLILDEMISILRWVGLFPVVRARQSSPSPKSLILLSPRGRIFAEVDTIREYFNKDTYGHLVVAVLETDDGSYRTDDRPNLRDIPEIQDSVYLFVRNGKLERRCFGLLYTWKNTQSLCRIYDTFHKDIHKTWLSPLWKWDAALGKPSVYGTMILSTGFLGVGLLKFVLRRG